jgi:hypothetical protein
VVIEVSFWVLASWRGQRRSRFHENDPKFNADAAANPMVTPRMEGLLRASHLKIEITGIA